MNRKFFHYIPAGALKVSGEDAFSYLQSQFSNDLRALNGAKKAVWGLFLNRKGGFVADGFVVKSDEETFRIFSYQSPSVLIQEKLEENIVADDVTCVIEENWFAATVWGDFNNVEAEYIFPGRRTRASHVELLSQNPINLEGIENSFDEWNAARILDGVGLAGVDLLPGQLPQECNMSDGVSISKGCYLGQEIMSRLENIGGVRKSLYVLQGKELDKDLILDGKIVASVTSRSGDGTIGLAVVKDSLISGLIKAVPGLTSVVKAQPFLCS